jgi:acyl-CoA synthetase (NDP forming)
MPDLTRLLAPRSVVIVGASPTPGALGASVLANLDRHGFQGDIHLINPKRDRIGDRPCLKSIDELPEGVDAAILAIPGPAVVDTLKALAARRVGSAVIFAAGFAEGGAEGLAAQAEVARIARDHDMVIEGPNCLGLVNYVNGVPLTFVETPPARLGDRPGIAIVSQSGAMAVVLGTMLMAKKLGISVSVSTGNEAATGVEDYVEHLIADPHSRVIGMIVEQFRDPARFLRLAQSARAAGKPIVLLHPGTSSAARESAATHTGAMAGDWDVMRAKVERAGVVLVDSLEELGDVLDIALRARPVTGGGTAVLAESGAFKALTLDLCEAIGLPLPELGAKTVAALRDILPGFIPVSNPMDLTAQALVDPDLYRRTLAPLLADPAISAVVLAIIQTDQATAGRKLPAIIQGIRELAPDKPVIYAGLDEGAEFDPAYVDDLRALGVPCFPSADRAFRALRQLAALAERDFERSDAAPQSIADLPTGVIPEYQAKRLLAPFGIHFPNGGFAPDLAEAIEIAARIGFPVALKAQSAALSHKSDAGGVILNIADVAALERAWAQLHQSVSTYMPGVALDGVLVEAMGERGTELIVGARNDPDWGPVILLGFGGVQAELLHDVRLLAHDLTPAAVIAELRKLRLAPLLDGFRGSPALDIEALADLVCRLGAVIEGTPAIREVDLNPVILYPRGGGVVALDALILAAD